MSDDQLDVIVIGAGPAGIAAGYEAAKAGLQVAVLERGDAAGSKNLTGGRLYLEPVRDLCGDLLERAAFERPVTQESITLTDDSSSLTVRVDQAAPVDPPHSVTVLRARLDPSLGDRLAEKGGLVLPQQRAEKLILENGRVTGVQVGPEALRARVLVAADGALSFMAEEAGLRKDRPAHAYGLGFKEVLKLDPGVIEDRFNLAQGEGAARLYMGRITKGFPGGAFLYTNRDSLSIGIVVNIGSVKESPPQEELWELLDAFKNRPDIAPLVAGAETVEYGAHAIPEGGYRHLAGPGVPGLLLAGDAAGFVLNTGATLRGMDLALASGALAGRTSAESIARDESPEACLGRYDRALRQSFVMKEMKAHRNAPDLLALKRIYDRYPSDMVRLAKDLFLVDQQGKGASFKSLVHRLVFRVLGWQGLLDLWRLTRI